MRLLWTQNVACDPRLRRMRPRTKPPQLPCPGRGAGAVKMSAMHTPAGFEPSHALPPAVAGDAHAFAFRGDQILALTGSRRDVRDPDAQQLARRGGRGQRAFPRPARHRGLRCARPARRGAPSPRACATSACARCSSRCPTRCWRSPRARSRSSTSTARIASADAAARPRAIGPTSARRSARPAASSSYPRVSPAMMALVTRGKEMLLARAHRFAPGMYSALAGFVEPGETIEDCVRREVREEVGVEVGELTYFASQSWAFPHSLMIAYTAEYAGGEIRLDDAEIAEARWFHVDDAAEAAGQRVDRAPPDRRDRGPAARRSRRGSGMTAKIAGPDASCSLVLARRCLPRSARRPALAQSDATTDPREFSRSRAQGLRAIAQGRARAHRREEIRRGDRDARQAPRGAAARAAGALPQGTGARRFRQDRRRHRDVPGGAGRLSRAARAAQQPRRALCAKGRIRASRATSSRPRSAPRRTTSSPTKTWATSMRASPR